MAMRVNTNVSSLNAQVAMSFNSNNITTSLERLSSGLRINKAADDASGMAIADSLRTQGNTLGQAIKNAQDAVGIVQIADKGMDEQLKILDTIKTKATQAAQDGQTGDTRKALQADITKLMEELDNIANTTSFNGQNLLTGQYTNKAFQIGDKSGQTISVNIGATSSDKIGAVRVETAGSSGVAGGGVGSMGGVSADGVATFKFLKVDGKTDITLESVSISQSAGTGIGALADVINKNSDKIGGIKASFTVQSTGSAAVAAGDVVSLTINGQYIGNISGVTANDSDGKLIAAINQYKDKTGVEATIDGNGRLNLKSADGRGIKIASENLSATTTISSSTENYGKLTLTRLDSRDIQISSTNSGNLANAFQFSGGGSTVAEAVVNLRQIKGNFDGDVASAAGANANAAAMADNANGLGTGVTTLKGAMLVMDIADSAIKMLDKIRGDIGSTQNQLTTTINNISVTQVNIKAAESQIRDVDFASESSSFSKYNILAQSGSYALSQANQTSQGVMRLLQ